MSTNFQYPYTSRLSGSPLTTEAKLEIAAVERPIVEIGGPTERGYRLLDKTTYLPHKPIVTNITKFFGFGPNNVHAQVDGKSMPFQDGSIGMFFASHLSLADYFTRAKLARTIAVEPHAIWQQRAEAEYEAALKDHSYQPQYNLRVAVLQEMLRTLVGNGLLLFEGLASADVEVARALGYTTILETQPADGLHDCIFKKLGQSSTQALEDFI